MAITSKWNKPVAWSLGVGAESVHRRIKDYLRLCKSCFVQAYSAGLAGDTQRF